MKVVAAWGGVLCLVLQVAACGGMDPGGEVGQIVAPAYGRCDLGNSQCEAGFECLATCPTCVNAVFVCLPIADLAEEPPGQIGDDPIDHGPPPDVIRP